MLDHCDTHRLPASQRSDFQPVPPPRRDRHLKVKFPVLQRRWKWMPCLLQPPSISRLPQKPVFPTLRLKVRPAMHQNRARIRFNSLADPKFGRMLQNDSAGICCVLPPDKRRRSKDPPQHELTEKKHAHPYKTAGLFGESAMLTRTHTSHKKPTRHKPARGMHGLALEAKRPHQPIESPTVSSPGVFQSPPPYPLP
jgi:hypothetical protein